MRRSLAGPSTLSLLAVVILGCRADENLAPPHAPGVGRPSFTVSGGPSAALSSGLSARAAIAFSSVPGLDRAYDINDAGLVVGDYGGNNIAAAWSRRDGFRSIGRLDGTTDCCSALTSVNAAGQAVGWSHTNVGVSVMGWSSASGQTTDLQIPGQTYGHAIDGHGNVVAGQFAGPEFPWYEPAGGSPTRLALGDSLFAGDPQALNDAGLIVGVVWTTVGKYHAAAWPGPDGSPALLGSLGGDQSWARGVNQVGDIVGWSELTPGDATRHAVLWPAGGSMIDLTAWPNPCPGSSEAADVNDAGVIVGRCDGQPVLWTAAEGMRPLTSPAWVSSGEPYAINNHNEVVGIVNGFGSGMWTVVLGPTIEAGDRHTCAIQPTGQVLCWGFGDNGQIAVPAGLGSVAAVMPGGYHTCVIRSADATVACWGENSAGQSQVPSNLGPVRALGAGTSHTCAIRLDGRLVCWGRDVEGQTDVPADLGAVLQVDGGIAFTCALRADHTVRCWGSNIDQNTNPAGQINVPPGLTGVSAIAVGFYHVCAVSSSGSLTCWGYSADGQTTPPAGLGPVAQTGATYHNCALDQAGGLSCWGFNGFGQTTIPPDLGHVARVAVGGYHTCAQRPEGTVSCWGINQFGELEVPPALRPATLLAQAIAFTSTPSDPAPVGDSYTVSATGGKSGNPVVFSSLTGSVCTVSGTSVALNAAGTCTVAADQAGNGSFAAAPQQTQSFDVGTPNRAPVASAGGPYTGPEGTALTFDGSSSSDPDHNAVSFAWSFGDGATATTADAATKPTHAYADNGTYTVTLTVTDAGGLSSTATTSATISNVAPTGTFNAPPSSAEGLKLTLALAPVTDPGTADVLSYSFDCGDGKGFSAPSPVSSRPCTPADNGTLAVRASVQDDDGGVTQYAASITVTNVAPTASFVLPRPVDEGSPYTLALTKPSDAPGDVASLQYAFTCVTGGPDSPFGGQTSYGCGTTDNGTPQVRGIIRDKDGGSTVYTGSVSVLNVAPTIVMELVQEPPTSRFRAVRFHFTDPGLNDGFPSQGNRWQVTVTWGDFAQDVGYFAQGQSIGASHTYSAANTWSIQITVRDKDGGATVTTVKTKVK